MSDQQGQAPQWPPQQPFQQTPYGQQQSFYTQPTQARPGQFQQPPYNSFSPQQKRPGVWGWYKTRTRKIKLSIGCGIILAILLLFSCIGSAIGSGHLAATPTPTATTSHAAAIIQSPAATQVPTPRPTHKPTPIPTSKPTSAPTHQPTPTQPPHTPTPCPGINCNPWGYNFSSPGKLIYAPPSGFCNYFNCIPTFYESDDPGDGYIVQCGDGMYSQSGGERGACSYHGGVQRPLYSH